MPTSYVESPLTPLFDGSHGILMRVYYTYNTWRGGCECYISGVYFKISRHQRINHSNNKLSVNINGVSNETTLGVIKMGTNAKGEKYGPDEMWVWGNGSSNLAYSSASGSSGGSKWFPISASYSFTYNKVKKYITVNSGVTVSWPASTASVSYYSSGNMSLNERNKYNPWIQLQISGGTGSNRLDRAYASPAPWEVYANVGNGIQTIYYDYNTVVNWIPTNSRSTTLYARSNTMSGGSIISTGSNFTVNATLDNSYEHKPHTSSGALSWAFDEGSKVQVGTKKYPVYGTTRAIVTLDLSKVSTFRPGNVANKNLKSFSFYGTTTGMDKALNASKSAGDVSGGKVNVYQTIESGSTYNTNVICTDYRDFTEDKHTDTALSGIGAGCMQYKLPECSFVAIRCDVDGVVNPDDQLNTYFKIHDLTGTYTVFEDQNTIDSITVEWGESNRSTLDNGATLNLGDMTIAEGKFTQNGDFVLGDGKITMNKHYKIKVSVRDKCGLCTDSNHTVLWDDIYPAKFLIDYIARTYDNTDDIDYGIALGKKAEKVNTLEIAEGWDVLINTEKKQYNLIEFIKAVQSGEVK